LFDTTIYQNDNVKSLKLGQDQIIYYGDPYNNNTAKEYKYIGEFYWLQNGQPKLSYSYDTTFHQNGSYHASYKQYFYDTNYNVIKVISNYDKSRGLLKEDRNYYPYNYTLGGAIGKLRDSGYINNVISSESWIVGDANPRMIAAGITSYQILASGNVKPDTVFMLESKKPILQTEIGLFNPAKLNRNYTFIAPQTKFVGYDSKGDLIESKSIQTGQSTSVIKGYENNYTVASISNALQNEIAYTSFESKLNGYWTVPSTARDLTASITGKKSYNLSNGSIIRSGLNTAKQYILSLWLKSGATASVNGTGVSAVLETHQGWNLYTVKLSGISTVTVSGIGLIDELRLHPVDANMTTNTYEPLVGVMSSADVTNNIVYNEYDKLGRLQFIRNKDRNILKKLEYTDTIMTISRAPQWVADGYECSLGNPGDIDSTVVDNNPFSDSYRVKYKMTGVRLDCSCQNAIGRPELKIVFGQCERGILSVTSSVYRKVGTNYYWFCTYRYCFTDGSQSADINVTQNTSSCPITCVIPL